jgi:hypothetical protein
VIIHHIASVYPIEVHLAKEVALGKAVEGIAWAVVAEMNASTPRIIRRRSLDPRSRMSEEANGPE